MAGINRAVQRMWESVAKLDRTDRRPCIFISHVNVDRESARDIGEFIRNDGNLDIYLDIDDPDLQRAVENKDPLGVTRFVERGLARSDNLLCLVSEKTVLSWWVPYEIGFTKKAGKGIATLLFKDAVTLPAYLEIGKVLVDIYDLKSYIQQISAARSFQRVSKAALDESASGSLLRKHLVPLRFKENMKILY
jgi:hypothetical protein